MVETALRTHIFIYLFAHLRFENRIQMSLQVAGFVKWPRALNYLARVHYHVFHIFREGNYVTDKLIVFRKGNHVTDKLIVQAVTLLPDTIW